MDLSYGYVTMCAASMAVSLSVGLGAWGHRRTIWAARPMTFVTVAVAVGAGAMGAQVVVPSLARAFGLITLVTIALVVAGFYCEVQALVDPTWRLRPRTLAWLSVHPVTVLALGALNPGQLFAAGTVVGGAPQLAAPPGPLFWLHLVYEYTLTAWSFHRLIRGIITGASPLRRRQLRSILLSAGLPLGATVITIARPRAGHTLPDLTPLSIALAGLVHYYAIFRQGLLRLLPVARDLVVEHVGDAILVTDNDDRVVDANVASRLLVNRLGTYPPGDLLGVPVWSLLPCDADRQTLTDGEYHLDAVDGPVDLDLRISDVRDRDGHVLGRVIAARDVTQLNEHRRQLTEQLYVIDGLRQELAEQTIRDDQTGLHNRRHLIRRLEDAVERARSTTRPLSLVMLDVDDLKSVNDRHGHTIGDALLTAISSALQVGIRPGQTLARFGGDEFVVLLPDTDPDEALHIAEALRSQCATAQVGSRRGPVSATLSGGVATFPHCGWTGSELLKNVDAALYAAKRAGRNRVVCAPGA